MVRAGRWRSALLGACLVAGLVAGNASADEIKGKVKGVVKKTKTVSIDVKDQGTVVVKVDDQTQFVNARNLRAIDPADLVRVVFEPVQGGNRASVIEKVVAKLPDGVGEIGTEELKSLLDAGAAFTLIDARPTSKYDMGHIPGAVSIPLAKLEKADAEGRVEALLGADKEALLVFYCGGIT